MGDAMGKLFVDPALLPDDAGGFVQVLFLMACYAFVLFYASNLIADGSELLLLIPSIAGLVGSVVLPILGAVPDGAIVLFSGLGGGKDAQANLNVGVGALAGSTIMLLTIPWALGVYAGRVNIVNGVGKYKKPKLIPSNNSDLFKTGVTVKPMVNFNAKLMLLTTLPYFIIQGGAFAEKCGQGDNCDGDSEKVFAGIGLLVCIAAFVLYLYFQVKNSHTEEKLDKLDIVIKRQISYGQVSLPAAYRDLIATLNKLQANAHLEPATQARGCCPCPSESRGLLEESNMEKRVNKVLRAFFNKYDANGDKVIIRDEFALLLQDMKIEYTIASLDGYMQSMDVDHDGKITFEEFKTEIRKLVLQSQKPRRVQVEEVTVREPIGGDDGEDSEDEEEEVPEDLAGLGHDQQMFRIKLRSVWMMVLGTALVLLFSDPMVGVLSEVGARVGISPFYVSFVLAPLASNASELLASYSYAAKKTKSTMTISFSALLGAGCMNNTLCLGIFLALIYFQPLAWEFAAETLSIVFVELVVGVVAFKQTHRLIDGVAIIVLFPLSILVVALLEKAGLN